jgi:antitoxin FitA
MANLTIRNLDDAVVEALKARAKQHNRSLEAEVRQILADEAERKRRLEERVARADRIAAMTPKGVKQTDSTDLIREDRER